MPVGGLSNSGSVPGLPLMSSGGGSGIRKNGGRAPPSPNKSSSGLRARDSAMKRMKESSRVTSAEQLASQAERGVNHKLLLQVSNVGGLNLPVPVILMTSETSQHDFTPRAHPTTPRSNWTH